MASSSALPDREDQQVMHAQDARPTPLHADAMLDGEVAGPDYGRSGTQGSAVSLPVPNGVAPSPPSDLVQVESLNGSPLASGLAAGAQGGAVPGTAFYTQKPGQLNRIPHGTHMGRWSVAR